MSIAPCGIHQKTAFVGADSFSVRFGTLSIKEILPPLFAFHRGIDGLLVFVEELRNEYVAFEFGLTNLSFDAATVDC